ncbi:MAG TPA: response regulator transcription factor [Planctomycetaceae bacterium]|jgi:two-component system OmpR family response regulator|nr:response regulator transcription factor [Planctomycetaceae bacterium]
MRVLVIEDDPDLLYAIACNLREEGHAVSTAEDGEDGLFKATSWDYDAIILDLMLPKLDGLTLLERLRRSKAVPVLILTAKDRVSDRVRGLDSGADDYLVKPFELAELRARLRALVRRATGKSPPLIEVQGVVIDTCSRSVTRNGVEIELTAQEYTLVELLARHRGRLVTRTMIYEHLYGKDDDSLSNLVEVHVSNIRKKLGHDFITTRRGQGYLVPS